MDQLEQVYHDFVSDVERAEHLLKLIKLFREFGGSTMPRITSSDEVLWPEASTLWDASQKRRTDLPWLSGSLLLYLAGRFEYYIRILVQIAAEDMADSVSDYKELPESLRSALKSRTLEVVKSPNRFGYNENEAEAFLLNLSSNIQGGSNSIKISSELLAITESNLKERAIVDLMKGLGLNEFWKTVGKQSNLKLVLETGSDSDTTVEAQNCLNTLMDERNQIAHPTSSTRFPDPDQVLKSGAFLKAFADVVTVIVRVHLAQFVAEK